MTYSILVNDSINDSVEEADNFHECLQDDHTVDDDEVAGNFSPSSLLAVDHLGF